MPDDLLSVGTEQGTPSPAEGTTSAASTSFVDAASSAADVAATEQSSAALAPQPEDPTAELKRLKSELAGTKGALTVSNKELAEARATAARVADLEKFVAETKQREADLKRATVTNQWVETELATYQQELAGMGIYEDTHVERLMAVRKRDLHALAVVGAQAEQAEKQQAQSKIEEAAFSNRRLAAGAAATNLTQMLKDVGIDRQVAADDLIGRLKYTPTDERAQDELRAAERSLFQELVKANASTSRIANNAARTAEGNDTFERGGQPSLSAKETWKLWGRQDPNVTKEQAIAARATLVREGVLLR